MATGASTTMANITKGTDRRTILTKLFNEKSALEREVTLKGLEIAEVIAAWTPDTYSEGEASNATRAAKRTTPAAPAHRGPLTNIGMLSGTSVHRPVAPTAVANDKSLDQLVFEILQEHKLVLGGIVEQVMRSGFKTNATKFRNSISQALLRLKSVKAIQQDKKTKEYTAFKNLGWTKVHERLSVRSKEMRQNRANG
jgi:hypothetical protein